MTTITRRSLVLGAMAVPIAQSALSQPATGNITRIVGIMAITGHATLKELVRYTKDANQAKLARNAMVKTITRTNGETKVSNSTEV